MIYTIYSYFQEFEKNEVENSINILMLEFY